LPANLTAAVASGEHQRADKPGQNALSIPIMVEMRRPQLVQNFVPGYINGDCKRKTNEIQYKRRVKL